MSRPCGDRGWDYTSRFRACAGARSAGNPHATCDVAGAGVRFTVRLVRHSQRKRGEMDRPDLRNTAPVLDATKGDGLPGSRDGCDAMARALTGALMGSDSTQGAELQLAEAPACCGIAPIC